MLNRQQNRPKAIMAVMQYNMRADRDPESARNLVTALKAGEHPALPARLCETTLTSSRAIVRDHRHGPEGLQAVELCHQQREEQLDPHPARGAVRFRDDDAGRDCRSTANIENGEHQFGMSLGFPFEGISGADAGSGGHYKLSAHLE